MKSIKKICKKIGISFLALSMTCVNYSRSTSQKLVKDVSAATNITSAGQTLSSGEYNLSQDLTASTGVSGIKVGSGATVIIYVSGNVTVTGGSADGKDIGAGAGIEVPANATLKIKGTGTLTVRGGAAANGVNGEDGYIQPNGGDRQKGGAGGAGGAGGGAGIGGKGGTGGAGAPTNTQDAGRNGEAGSSGTGGTGCGNVFLLGDVSVTAYGGSAGKKGAGGVGGKAYTEWHSGATKDAVGGGGGGGGGGAGGYPGAAIGGGGAGGGGGGSGGTGGWEKAASGDNCEVGGGGGGAGGYGYNSGGGGKGGQSWQQKTDAVDGESGNTTTGGAGGTANDNDNGGTGGAGGDSANGGIGGTLYKSTYNTYNATMSAGGGKSSVSNGSTKVAYDVRKFTYSFSECVYNAKEQKPTVSIYHESTKITDGYTSSYDNNVDATTTAEFKISGSETMSSSYFVTGDLTKNFTIKRATFTPTITLTSSSVTYWNSSTAEVKGIPTNKGSGGEVTWTVNSGSADLTNAASTTVTFKPTSAGQLQLKATIAQSTNYESAFATANVSVPKVQASSYNIADIDPLTYTGDSLTPKPIVKYNNVALKENTDFTYSYANNKNQGTATVTVTGQNNYTGSQSKTFLISQKDIGDSNVTIDSIADQTYTGSEIVPAPVIHYNNKVLVKGTDYNISYVNHKTCGTATINIQGINNFKDSRKITFKVVPKNINQIELTAPQNVTFTGKNIESRPTLKYNGMTLVEGTDYKLEFSNHLLVGKATVKITGMGNYEGTRTTYYQINKRIVDVYADLNQSKIYGTLEPSEYTYRWENDCADEGYSATFTGRLEREPGEMIGTYEIIQGTLALSEESAKHYTLRYNSAKFYINKWDASDLNASLDGTMGNNEWYVSTVKVVAPKNCKIGYTDLLEDDNWKDYITFSDGDYSRTGVTYFIKSDENDAVSVAKNIKFKQDTTNPNGSIIIGNDAFTEFLNTITFNMFFNHSVEAKINGSDSLSGLYSVQYIESQSALTYDELDAIPDNGDKETLHWTTSYTATIKEEKGIIYVKITDYAGNHIYMNTEGIIYDMDKPELGASYEFDGIWTKQDNPIITGSTRDILAGLKERYASYTYTDGTNEVTQILNVDDEGQFIIEHLPDGHYTLTISAMDNAGNYADDIAFEVMKDTVVPEVELLADTATISSSQTITFTTVTGCSGPNRIEIFENDEWKTVENAFSEGYVATKSDYEYRFRLIDNAGGISEEKVIVFNNIDTEKPVVSYKGLYENDTEYLENVYTNQQIRVRFQNTSANKGKAVYEYKLDDGDWNVLIDNNGVCTTPALTDEGHHIFTMRITSQAGVVSEEVSFGVKYDITPPVSDIIITTDVLKKMLRTVTFGSYFQDVQTIHISSSDPESGAISSGIDTIEYFIYQSLENEFLTDVPTSPDKIEQLVDGNWVKGTSCTINPDYSYVIFVRVTDKAGNKIYTNTDGLVVDATAPEMNIDYDYNDSWTHHAQIKVTALDNLSGIDKFLVSIDGGEFVDKPFVNNQILIENFEDGEHTVQIQVTDKSGNIMISDTIIVKQDNVTPTITLNPENDDIAPSRHVDIQTEHLGLSKIDRVEVKHDDEWEDITDYYQDGYVVKENGTFTLRVTSQAGLYDEETVTYNNIYADALDPNIAAFSEDGIEINNNGWGHGEVAVQMFNNPTNINGIDYYYLLDGGEWTKITAEHGLATLIVTGEGKHSVSFQEKSQSDATLESDIQTIEFTIDNTDPEVSITVDDKNWSTSGIFRNIRFEGLFKDDQMFTIDAKDNDSGIAHVYYYIDKSQDDELLENEYILSSDIEALVDNQWIEGKMGNLKSGRSYLIYTKVIDNAGNIKYFSSQGIIIDDLSPEISSAHKEEDWIVDDTETVDIEIKETLSGIDLSQDNVQYSINDGEFITPTQITDGHLIISASELDEGNNIITVSAKDRVGNASEDFKLIVKKDTVDPKIILSKETLGHSTTENKLNIECLTGKSGIQKVELLSGDEWKDITATYKDGFKPTQDGIYTVKLTDGAKREISAQSTFSNLDSTQPVVDVTMLTTDDTIYQSGEWTNQAVEISYGNVAHNEGAVQYLHSIDGGNFIQDTPDQEGICHLSVNEEGTHDIRMKIINKTGLESVEYQITVNQDMSGPEVDVQMLEGWYTQQKVSVTANDRLSGIPSQLAYSFDDGETWQDDYIVNIEKNSVLNIVVRDAVGNETRITKTVEVDNLEPVVEEAMMNTQDWAKEKTIRAVIHDNIATDESSSSGIATVFLTSKNPYKNGQLVKKSPSLTDYMMKLENGDVYKTVSPVTDSLGIILEDNYWIVVIDNAGNAVTYTMTIDKIIRDEVDDPNQPSNPNQPTNPSQPSNPNEPIHPNNPTITPTQPGQSGSNTQKPQQGGSMNQNPTQNLPESNHQSSNHLSNGVVDKSLDKINSIAEDIHKTDKDKISGFEEVLNDLLENGNLSNSERMIILSTLEQLQQANDLELNAKVVLDIINNDYTDHEDAFAVLDQADQLLGTSNSSVESSKKQIQNNQMIIYLIPLVICSLTAALIILRARHKYTNKGGHRDE